MPRLRRGLESEEMERVANGGGGGGTEDSHFRTRLRAAFSRTTF